MWKVLSNSQSYRRHLDQARSDRSLCGSGFSSLRSWSPRRSQLWWRKRQGMQQGCRSQGISMRGKRSSVTADHLGTGCHHQAQRAPRCTHTHLTPHNARTYGMKKHGKSSSVTADPFGSPVTASWPSSSSSSSSSSSLRRRCSAVYFVYSYCYSHSYC